MDGLLRRKLIASLVSSAFWSGPLPSVSLKFKPLHYFSLRLTFGQTPAQSARGKTIKSTDKLKHKKVTKHFELCNKK